MAPRINTRRQRVFNFAAALFAGAAFFYSPAQATEYIQYAIEGNYFKCDIPKGWRINRDKFADEAEKVYGVEAVGPRTKEGVPVRITMDYFSRDNTLFRGPSEYINRHTSAGVIKIEGDRYGPVKTITLSNRRAKTFEKETTAYFPPNSPMAAEIAIKEKLVVLPASEGFYALRYYAQASAYEKYFYLFERVLESFVPMRLKNEGSLLRPASVSGQSAGRDIAEMPSQKASPEVKTGFWERLRNYFRHWYEKFTGRDKQP